MRSMTSSRGARRASPRARPSDAPSRRGEGPALMNVRNRDLFLVLGAVLGASVTVVACSNSPQPAASNCPTVSSDCPSPPPSWSKDVQPLIQQYCVMCHQPGGIGESLADLTSYTNVFRARA